jgi:hypothetical protein
MTTPVISSDSAILIVSELELQRHVTKDKARLENLQKRKSFKILIILFESKTYIQPGNNTGPKDVLLIATPPFSLAASINSWELCIEWTITDTARADQ